MRIHLFAITLFGVLGLSLFSYGQHCSHKRCSHVHRNLEKNSADDNLRSDTLDVLLYDIDLDLTNASNQEISGACKVVFTSKENGINTISLDLLSLSVDSVVQHGSLVNFTYNDTLLVSNLNNTLNVGDEDSITVYYSGSPVLDQSGWGGFYFSGNYSFNLGVGFQDNPHNFGRAWHPCFDNFVERALYNISIKTQPSQKGYANGVLVNEVNDGSSNITYWELSQPIPTYLACVAAANYTHVDQTYTSALTNTDIPVYLIATPGDTSNFKSSFVNLFGAMDGFEDRYGPYLWDKVGFHLVPFNGGAMEHATSVAYPASSAGGNTASETLMAHELAHHWWGNLVTCRTAEDMWINEGMASYCERIFLEYVYGYPSYISDIRSNHKSVLLNAHVRDTGYYPLSGVPHNITYGSTTYDKGADVAHTMRSYMGDSTYFAATTAFLNDHTFEDVSAEDFRDYLTANSNVDMTDFFDNWIFEPGFPAFEIDSFEVISAAGQYDITIHIQQKLKGATNFYSNVPMEVMFVDDQWNIYSEEVILNGEFSSATFTSPFNPEMIYLNGNDKISQAVTGENLTLTSNGIKDLNYPMFRFTTNNISDSTLMRIEHYWVAPDGFKEPVNDWSYHISQERYWKVDGIWPSDYEAQGRVFFNGKEQLGGYLDTELCNEPGFHEDSLKILYRPNASENWQEVEVDLIGNLGSNTDGYGYISFPNLQKGEYTFGWRKSPVNVEELDESIEISVFPNPTSDWLKVQGTISFSGAYQVIITDISGKVIYEKPYFSNQINVSDFVKGVYHLELLKTINGQSSEAISFVVE